MVAVAKYRYLGGLTEMHSLAGVQNQGGSQGWCLLRAMRDASVPDFSLWLVDDHLLYLFMSSSLYVCLSLPNF